MNLHLAETLLTKTNFNSYDDWETYPTADYLCKCGQTVAINFRNLQKHSQSDFTNLKKEDAGQIKQLAESIKEQTDSFIDFYCPQCKRPVRIYYYSWAGGRHGEYGFRLKYIIQ